MNGLPLRPAADIGVVEDRSFTLRNFLLTDGAVMPEATIAYETYRRPASDGRNAILCTHGYTASHHFAGRNPANGNQPGSWDGLIGPGKAIDTDKLFVVASNMLGSSFGSTNAGSINPQTAGAYGPDFPNITIRDIVAAQKALLDHLGVRHLVAVAGPSYGGYQAFQWAVAYPDFMDAIVPLLSRLVWRLLDWLDYRMWDARLRTVDALYGPEPETEADRERNPKHPVPGWRTHGDRGKAMDEA